MTFAPGDLVVYSKEKVGLRPARRAHHVSAAPLGDSYHYFVDKVWIVVDRDGNQLVLRTPRGKLHRLGTDDPHLRRTSWSERAWLRLRSPHRWRILRGA